jgi:hypothetical protein
MPEVFRSTDISYVFICLIRFLHSEMFISLSLPSLVDREVLLYEVRHTFRRSEKNVSLIWLLYCLLAEVVSISVYMYYHFVFQSDEDMTVPLLRFISIYFETGSNI